MAERIAARPNLRLRHQRRLRGWTLADVADGLHGLHHLAGNETDLGVDSHMVGRWERGVRRPSPGYVGLLCRLFELPADELGLIEETPEVRPACAAGLPVTWSFAPTVTMTVAGRSEQCGIEGTRA
jgi:transcriptional regulator with XRE-family HTH domain